MTDEPGPDSRARSRRLAARFARLLTVALVVGLGISQLILTAGDWHLRDAGAYWDAAVRLREGEPLYPGLADTGIGGVPLSAMAGVGVDPLHVPPPATR